MNYLRLQAVNEEPSAVTLVLLLVQTPTSLIGNGVLVETFRCSTPGFSNPDGGLAESTKHFGKIVIADTQPLLQLGASLKMHYMV